MSLRFGWNLWKIRWRVEMPNNSWLNNGGKPMQMYIALQPLVAIIAGILILMIPRLLNYIVAIYLIVTGILGLARM